MSEPTGTQYAGFWARCIALLADTAILFLVFALALVGAALVFDAELLAPIAFALSLLSLLYWPVMHASGMQGTLGKALVGIKVTRLDARRISILRSLWREIAKAFSAAVLMLGYIMAAFTPRKQALHDLMSATYVVHDGPARLLPALAVALVGFAAPVVVGPMVIAGSVMSQLTGTAQGMLAGHVPGMHQPAPQPIAKAAPKPVPVVAKAAPKPQPPAPVAETPVAEKKAPLPAPVAEQKAPAPAPVAEAKTPTPPPISIAAVAPAVVPDKPKVVTERKPKPAARKPAARVAKAPAPAPAADLKRVSGPKYNDLMTAVLYRDVESVSELLKLGKWVDKPDSRGATPLMVAAELGDVRVAEALLRGGANAGLALRTAEERSNGEMLELLKRYSKR